MRKFVISLTTVAMLTMATVVWAEKPVAQPDAAAAVRGVKLLVALDIWGGGGGEGEINRRTGLIEKAFQKAGLKVVRKVNASSYLLDLGGKQVEEALKGVPFRQGAMVFQNGNFQKSIPFANVYHGGQRLRQPRMRRCGGVAAPGIVRSWSGT